MTRTRVLKLTPLRVLTNYHEGDILGVSAMSDCVLSSYVNHLNYIGLEPAFEHYLYGGVRQAARVYRGEYTPGAITPLIYQLMAKARGLDLIVQSRRGTREFYLECLEDEVQREMARLGEWGEEVDTVSLTPAIHLLINRSHAQFVVNGIYDERVVVEMAFQFRRK